MARLPVDMEINAVITQIQIDHAAEQRLTDQYNRAMAGPGFMRGTTREQYAAAQGRTQRGGILPMLAKSAGMETLFTTLIPAISALTGVLVMAVSNSKIVATVMNTVGKALGLLVDLILMPFLPIIMWVLIKLFGAIIAFGKIWKDIWGSEIVKNFVAGVLALDKSIRDLILGGIGFLVDLSLKTLGIVWDVLVWLYEKLKAGAGVAVDFLFSAAGVVYDVLKWIWDTIVAGGQLAFKIGMDWLDDKVKEMVSFLEWLKKIAVDGIDIIVNLLPKAKPVSEGGTGYITPSQIPGLGFFESLGKGFGEILGIKQQGGSIDKTGPYILHKGETVIPAGGGINVTIIGTYQNDEDLYKKFVDKLRRDQWRYNA
jgi:hypothetical protein